MERINPEGLDLKDQVISINRVTKVVKGGKNLSFAALVVVGDTNGIVGVKAIPAIAHPIHGWTSCTSCHSDATLVATAPGHSGLHAQECLVCHQDSSDPAPTPRHETLPDSNCLSCHGTVAPLPSSMADRPATLCWLCHHR